MEQSFVMYWTHISDFLTSIVHVHPNQPNNLIYFANNAREKKVFFHVGTNERPIHLVCIWPAHTRQYIESVCAAFCVWNSFSSFSRFVLSCFPFFSLLPSLAACSTRVWGNHEENSAQCFIGWTKRNIWCGKSQQIELIFVRGWAKNFPRKIEFNGNFIWREGGNKSLWWMLFSCIIEGCLECCDKKEMKKRKKRK
jgi:hypothetical protein